MSTERTTSLQSRRKNILAVRNHTPERKPVLQHRGSSMTRTSFASSGLCNLAQTTIRDRSIAPRKRRNENLVGLMPIAPILPARHFSSAVFSNLSPRTRGSDRRRPSGQPVELPIPMLPSPQVRTRHLPRQKYCMATNLSRRQGPSRRRRRRKKPLPRCTSSLPMRSSLSRSPVSRTRYYSLSCGISSSLRCYHHRAYRAHRKTRQRRRYQRTSRNVCRANETCAKRCSNSSLNSNLKTWTGSGSRTSKRSNDLPGFAEPRGSSRSTQESGGALARVISPRTTGAQYTDTGDPSVSGAQSSLSANVCAAAADQPGGERLAVGQVAWERLAAFLHRAVSLRGLTAALDIAVSLIGCIISRSPRIRLDGTYISVVTVCPSCAAITALHES